MHYKNLPVAKAVGNDYFRLNHMKYNKMSLGVEWMNERVSVCCNA